MKTRAMCAEASSTEAMDSLKIATLHPAYAAASPADRIAMANLGAACWSAVKDGLFVQWAEAMSAEEGAKADVWRKEGRVAALEEMGTKLSVVEGLTARLAAADATIAQLRGAIEAEVSVRVGQQMEVLRKDYELAGMKEMAVLQQQVAAAEAREAAFAMVSEGHVVMKEKVAALQAELDKLREAATKSSHALGKMGEKEMFDMITTHVLPRFTYSEVRDMTAVKHAGDFHLRLFGSDGRRIKIMIDVKKYSGSVQSCEIEKLWSDMDGDVDADAGLLVSLKSGISGKPQFGISYTTGLKPCMYLTFERVEAEMRPEILCWALSVLAEVVIARDRKGQDTKMIEVQMFLEELGAAVGELDDCMKASMMIHETLRNMKERIVTKLSKFGVTSAVAAASTTDEMRCRGKVHTGNQCKGRRIPSGLLCARHAAAEASGKVVEMVTFS
jgi:hypothetical protein